MRPFLRTLTALIVLVTAVIGLLAVSLPLLRDKDSTPIIVTATPTPFPTTPPNQVSRCEWLARNFPQSKEAVSSKFGLPVDRINLLYEACGNTVTAFVVTLGTDVELQVYEEGGCIDAPSDATFTGIIFPTLMQVENALTAGMCVPSL